MCLCIQQSMFLFRFFPDLTVIYWKSQSYATHVIIYKHSLTRCPWGFSVSLVINTPSWFLKIKSTMLSWLGKYSSLWEQTFMLHYFVTLTTFIFERVFYFHWYKCSMCLYADIIVSNIFKWYILFYSNYPPYNISTLIFRFFMRCWWVYIKCLVSQSLRNACYRHWDWVTIAQGLFQCMQWIGFEVKKMFYSDYNFK